MSIAFYVRGFKQLMYFGILGIIVVALLVGFTENISTNILVGALIMIMVIVSAYIWELM